MPSIDVAINELNQKVDRLMKEGLKGVALEELKTDAAAQALAALGKVAQRFDADMKAEIGRYATNREEAIKELRTLPDRVRVVEATVESFRAELDGAKVQIKEALTRFSAAESTVAQLSPIAQGAELAAGDAKVTAQAAQVAGQEARNAAQAAESKAQEGIAAQGKKLDDLTAQHATLAVDVGQLRDMVNRLNDVARHAPPTV